MAGGIFISYRREDSAHAAGRLVDRLGLQFARDQIFFDVDNIAPGLDFKKVLTERVTTCDVLLAVIGREWLEARDEDGLRRLDNPKDFVRIEVEAALGRGIRVIPVLVDGARMPREHDLPPTLQPLIDRHAVRLVHERFAADAEGLIKALRDIMAAAEGAAVAPAAVSIASTKGETEGSKLPAKLDPKADRPKPAGRRAPWLRPNPVVPPRSPQPSPEAQRAKQAQAAYPFVGPASAPLGAQIAGLGIVLALFAAITFLFQLATPQTSTGAADTTLVVVATLVMLVSGVPGAALFYAGLAGDRIGPQFGKVVVMTALTAAVFFVYGFSLAFSDGGSWQPYIGGLDKAFLSGITPASMQGTIPELVFVLFMTVSACVPAVLLMAAFIGRLPFAAVLFLTLLWTSLVHLPLAHWTWGGGWIGNGGALDFSGATPILIPVGISGLVGLALLPGSASSTTDVRSPLAMRAIFIGAALLGASWLAMVAGSWIAASPSAPISVFRTIVAMAAGAGAWLIAELASRGKPSPLGLVWGAMAGATSLAAGTGFISLLFAAVLGVAAALACFAAVPLVSRRIGILGEPFAIYAVAGIVGLVGTGTFAAASVGEKSGLIDGNPGLVAIQVVAAIATVAWSAALSAALFKLAHALFGARAPA